MMLRTAITIALLLPVEAAVASSELPPLEWLGSSPHIAIEGTLGGQPLELTKDAVTDLQIKRHYGERDGYVFMTGIEVIVPSNSSSANADKPWSIAFTNANFDNHRLPDLYDVQATDTPTGQVVSMELRHGGVAPTGDWLGMLSVNYDSGMITENGHHEDGMVGLYLVAENGADTLMLSVTAPAE